MQFWAESIIMTLCSSSAEMGTWDQMAPGWGHGCGAGVGSSWKGGTQLCEFPGRERAGGAAVPAPAPRAVVCAGAAASGPAAGAGSWCG